MRPRVGAMPIRLLGVVSLIAIGALATGSPVAASDRATAPSRVVGSGVGAVLPDALVTTGSLRLTSTAVNARGHPTLASKVLFIVPSGTTVRVYRIAIDAAHRSWYLVHVDGRPGWIAGWLTKTAPVRAAALWHIAMASSFGIGDGLVGHGMACGSTLTSSVMAVANRTLPCGSRIRIRVGARTVTARVLDRGPWVTGRTFDLGPAVCRALRSCSGVFRIQWQRVP